MFALWQLPIGERLLASLGGRIDDVPNVDRFETWRATLAYLIPETGTKLRTTAGTGDTQSCTSSGAPNPGNTNPGHDERCPRTKPRPARSKLMAKNL